MKLNSYLIVVLASTCFACSSSTGGTATAAAADTTGSQDTAASAQDSATGQPGADTKSTTGTVPCFTDAVHSQACKTCAQGKCSAEFFKCAPDQSGAHSCNWALNCLTSATDCASQTKCRTDMGTEPSGALYDAFLTCTAAQCKVECGG